MLAITLHNIPEGLAVGVAFGAVDRGGGTATFAAAVTLAVGIGLQYLPEGIAVAMPLRGEGVSRRRSFRYGQLSAVVEPFAPDSARRPRCWSSPPCPTPSPSPPAL